MALLNAKSFTLEIFGGEKSYQGLIDLFISQSALKRPVDLHYFNDSEVRYNLTLYNNYLLIYYYYYIFGDNKSLLPVEGEQNIKHLKFVSVLLFINPFSNFYKKMIIKYS